MAMMLFFCIIGGVLWIYSSSVFLSRNILRHYALILFLVSFMTFGISVLLIKNDKTSSEYYLLFIPLFLASMFYTRYRKKMKDLRVVADQQRYWEEVKPEDVDNFYQHRKKEKEKRISVSVNVKDKKFFKIFEINQNENKRYISLSFFKTLKRIENEFTVVKNTDELKKYYLYDIVFKKIKGIIKQAEKMVDYEEVLKNNNYYAEFFLLFLWENYTQRTNISNSNLLILAEREIEEEFVGALDNIDLNSVKKRGSALYYRYMVFYNRDVKYITRENKELEGNFL
ncbi:hypothetical protein [Campylobacter sp. US33a]|uniref:hypothetical protein n=1 Tax=Campylobacter sp. US33a TaxID=2498120 RepID=UPI00106892FF|nr:hypothetical protein [Campylobacter sp. US33a]TEY00691.1 hypothetical protein ELQ16_08625 [Campylobacter sp. US33a]